MGEGAIRLGHLVRVFLLLHHRARVVVGVDDFGGQRIVYVAFEKVSEKLEKGDPVDLMLGALENARPRLEVKSRRVGGATYQVPIEISFERQESLAIRWIVDAAGSRRGITMRDALAAELIDAYNNTGSVVKKKEDTHKMAQANRAFAHLRW